MDPNYNIVNNRIDSYYYHEWDVSFMADKSLNVINILHANIWSIGSNLNNFLEALGDLSVLALFET